MATLKHGSQGREVKELQVQLDELGYDPGEADGIFGDLTEEAVVAFQEDYELEPDGVVGPKTRRALKDAVEDLEDEDEDDDEEDA